MMRTWAFGLFAVLSASVFGIDIMPKMKITLDEKPIDIGVIGATQDRFYGDLNRLLRVFAPGTVTEVKGSRVRLLKDGKLWMDLPFETEVAPSGTAKVYNPPGATTAMSVRYDDVAMQDRDLGLAVNLDYFAALFDVTTDVEQDQVNFYSPKFWLARLGAPASMTASHVNAPNLVEDFGVTPPAKTLRLWVRPTKAAHVQIYRVGGGELPRPMFGKDIVTGQVKQFTMGDIPASAAASPTQEARAETTFFEKMVGSKGLYVAVVTTRAVPDPRRAILDGTLAKGDFSVVGLSQRVADQPISFSEATVASGETWIKLEERLKTSIELLKAINGYLQSSNPTPGAKLTYIESVGTVQAVDRPYEELGWYGVQTRDTLAKLAADWAVQQADIVAANPALIGMEPIAGDLIVRIGPKTPTNPVNPARAGREINKIMRLVRPTGAFTEPRPDAPTGDPLPQGAKINAIQEVAPGLIQALVDGEEVYFRQEDLALPSQPEQPTADNPPPSDPEPVPIAPAQLSNLSGSRALIQNAFKFVGTPYKWGGSSLRGGIDCSHFVQEIFRYTKFAKPPSAPVINQEQSGQVVHRKPGTTTIWRGMKSFNASNVPDRLSALRVGDRFIHQKTPGRAISGHRHTGVYVGRVRYRKKVYNHAVIHSSGRRGIDVDELTGYLWKAYRYSVRDAARSTR